MPRPTFFISNVLKISGLSYGTQSSARTLWKANTRRFLSTPPKRTKEIRIVKTLDPCKMSSMGQETLDLSGKIRPIVRIHPWGRASLLFWKERGEINTPFPPGTIGALYYHRPRPEQPPIAGGLRFRLISDVTAFDSGTDLCETDGDVWETPLYNIAKNVNWESLRNKLVEESLVDEDLIKDLQGLPLNSRSPVKYHYELEQPFVHDLQKTSIRKTFINRSMVHNMTWHGTFSLYSLYFRGKTVPPPYYSGQLLVRFELDDDPSSGPRLVIRILDILTPVQCLHPTHDLFEAPIPGELLSRSKKWYGEYAGPLSYSLRRKGGRDLAAFLRKP